MPAHAALHVTVVEGFADWEPGHSLPKLRRWGKRTVRRVGFMEALAARIGHAAT